MLHPDLPMYLRDVTFTTETQDQETRRVVNLKLQVAPFTAAMAEELGPGVRERLFRRTDGEPVEDIREIKFGLSLPMQTMTIRLAVDQTDDPVRVLHAKVAPEIRIKRDKETPTFEANFSVNFRYPTPPELMFLAMHVNDQMIFSFADEQLSMLDEPEKKKGRGRKPKEEQPELPAGEKTEEKAETVN